MPPLIPNPVLLTFVGLAQSLGKAKPHQNPMDSVMIDAYAVIPIDHPSKSTCAYTIRDIGFPDRPNLLFIDKSRWTAILPPNVGNAAGFKVFAPYLIHTTNTNM